MTKTILRSKVRPPVWSSEQIISTQAISYKYWNFPSYNISWIIEWDIPEISHIKIMYSLGCFFIPTLCIHFFFDI